jgi:hypothetical protein
MSAQNPDTVRQSVLDRMERSDKLMRSALIGAAIVEALLLFVVLRLLDWHDRVDRLLFVLFMLNYMVLSLGLIALGGHVSRSIGRVLLAMDPGSPR